MCHNKNSPPPNHARHVKLIRTRSISMMKIIKEEEDEVKPVKKPKRATAAARKSRKKRSRRKKPKYLSLRSSRLSARNDAVSTAAVDDVDSKMTTEAAARRRGQQQQLNLFPLHPELNAAEAAAADHQSDDNVALLFESEGGATLHGLLTSTDTATTTTSTMSSDHDQAESNYGYRRGGGEDIVRTAMRGSGGDRSVEKWVCYSELVKEEVELTATTSSASTCCSVGDDRKSHQDQRLALKLDYEEVLNAWSDKGSLYIKTEDGEPPPQTVPDLLQDQLFQHLHDSSANIEDLWRVPEEGGSLERKRVQRQESLLRYKRKRENRLFSKQIRYEVRKLNAEKRPRVKGRFVRSS
ncbi:hypothetical protein ACLB2K_061479 [Fragaria x ananassa]